MALSTAVQVTTSCALPGATVTPITCARSGGGGGPSLTDWPLNAGASLPASSCTGFDAGGAYASVTVAPAAGAASSASVTQMPYIDTSDTAGFVVVAPTVAVTVYAPVAGIEAGSSGSS